MYSVFTNMHYYHFCAVTLARDTRGFRSKVGVVKSESRIKPGQVHIKRWTCTTTHAIFDGPEYSECLDSSGGIYDECPSTNILTNRAKISAFLIEKHVAYAQAQTFVSHRAVHQLYSSGRPASNPEIIETSNATVCVGYGGALYSISCAKCAEPCLLHNCLLAANGN